MRTKNEMLILPKKFYIGQTIDPIKFSQKAGNTNRLDKELRFFGGRDINILYSINGRNSNLHWDVDNVKELQFLQVPVETRIIKDNNILQLAKAIQRGVPYQLVIILSCKDTYKVILPHWHKGKLKDIAVVERIIQTTWMQINDLRDLFLDVRIGLSKNEFIFYSDLWESLCCSIDKRVLYLEKGKNSYERDPLAVDDEKLPKYYDDEEWIIYLTEAIGSDELELLLHTEVESESEDEDSSILIEKILLAAEQALDRDDYCCIEEELRSWLRQIRLEDLIGMVELNSQGLLDVY